jgi:hypothetical protein
VLYYFKSRKQLKQLSFSQLHLHKRGRTNLEREGKTEAVIRIEATLVNSTISLYVTACCLESIRAITRNQRRQTKTSVKCVIRKAITRETVPCLSKSDLTVLRKKIVVKLYKQRKQGT